MMIKNWISRNAFSLGIFLSLLFLQFTNWPPLAFWGWWGGGNFQDSWQVLKSADCYGSIGLAVYQVNNQCMLYVYGRPLLWILNFFNLGASQASLLGIVFLIILAFTLGYVLKLPKIENKYRIILTIIVLFAPPVLLLGDRANFDTLIVGSIFLSLSLIRSHKYAYSIIVIFVVTLFKYYTLPLLIFLVFISKSWRVKLLGTFLTAASIFSIYRDLSITEFKFKSDNPHLTFGIGHEFLYSAKYNRLSWISDHSQLFGTIEIAILVVSCILLLNRYVQLDSFREANLDVKSLYFMSTIVVLTCYFSGFNADYRLIFFVISAFSLITIFQDQTDFRNLLLAILILTLWLTFPSGDLEIIGDFSISIYISMNVAILLMLIRKRLLRTLIK